MLISSSTQTNSRSFKCNPEQNTRKRKHYFECQHAQQERNREMIKKEAFLLNEFCKSIGLHIKEIILANYEIDQEPKKHKNNQEIHLNDNQIIFKNTRHIKINILENDIYLKTDNFKALKCLEAKDLTNLSNEKYNLLRNKLSEIIPFRLVGLKQLYRLKINLNNFFRITENQNGKGFFVDPEHKINFVCRKFLEKTGFQSNLIRIKLSCDGVNITRTKIKLINFSFNILDDQKNALNVNNTHILGNILFLSFKL
jgi:hypothetical protein